VAVEYANKNEKLTIVGGSLGERTLDLAGVKALATLPSLDEMRARLVGLLKAPATKIAGVLAASGRRTCAGYRRACPQGGGELSSSSWTFFEPEIPGEPNVRPCQAG